MSALPSKADMLTTGIDVRLVPIADMDHNTMVLLDICRHPGSRSIKGLKEAFCIFRKKTVVRPIVRVHRSCIASQAMIEVSAPSRKKRQLPLPSIPPRTR